VIDTSATRVIDDAAQLHVKIGSPGWARTSDFLINSPTGTLTTGAHGDLSPRVLDGSCGACRPVRRGESRWFGTNVEPPPAGSVSAVEQRVPAFRTCRQRPGELWPVPLPRRHCGSRGRVRPAH
jgi:hypothetical protein